jgi:uncharacterized membrane protein YphA (DoxX/SURF4 family)
VRCVISYVPGLVAQPRDPRNWTSGFELIALGGAAISLLREKTFAQNDRLFVRAGLVGRVLFGTSLLVFAIQHFLYARFIAGLIPSWIPLRVPWAYLVGVLFLAAALSIMTGVLGRLAATLLSVMFFIWVWIVHLPRVFSNPLDGREWTSLFVALSMCAGALIIASTFRRVHPHP